MPPEELSFPMAVRKYLSLPGETSTSLIGQIRQLTDKDKDDLIGYFAEQGIAVKRATS